MCDYCEVIEAFDMQYNAYKDLPESNGEVHREWIVREIKTGKYHKVAVGINYEHKEPIEECPICKLNLKGE
jgi:hypothetical protein